MRILAQIFKTIDGFVGLYVRKSNPIMKKDLRPVFKEEKKSTKGKKEIIKKKKSPRELKKKKEIHKKKKYKEEIQVKSHLKRKIIHQKIQEKEEDLKSKD